MKTTHYLFIALLSFTGHACKQGTGGSEIRMDDSLFTTIAIDMDDIKTAHGPISRVAAGIEYIPLETRDSILVGNIQKLIAWNDRFYIWDDVSESIFCFDASGKFIFKIDDQGRGPGEYPRVSDFTVHRKSGKIYIHSDMSQAFLEYSSEGQFIKKIPVTLLLNSFGVQEEGEFLCYTGRLPNAGFYRSTFPEQYRYVVLRDNKSVHEQLKFTYHEKFLRLVMSGDNFSFHGDTLLLVESLQPEVYSIDSAGHLVPRYRIEFSTNTYHPSFDDADQQRIDDLTRAGKYTKLFGHFHESDNYIFLNYARGMIGLACVDKRAGEVHNLGYFLLDDMNHIPMPTRVRYLDNQDNAYMVTEPHLLITNQAKGKQVTTPYLRDLVARLHDSDNPVIVKIKLK